MWRIVLLIAFLLQGTIVQTHVHAAQLAAPAAISVSQDAAGQQDSPAKHAPDGAMGACFLCWEAAAAGQYYQPAASVLALPPDLARWTAAQAEHEFALGKSSHGWLSRAPPQ